MPPTKYTFRPTFEAGLVGHLATNTKFASRFLAHLHEDLFNDSTSKWIFKLLKADTKTNGTGSQSLAAFEQRVWREHTEGRIDLEAHDLALGAVAMGLAACPDSAVLDAEMIATLQSFHKGADFHDLTMTFAKKGDINPILTKMIKLDEIGKTEAASKVFDIDHGLFAHLKSQGAVIQQPTGADQVDMLMGGGLPLGSIGLVLGSTGAGKSQFMCQIAATGLVTAQNVAYISLEMSAENICRRIAAAMSGIPVNLVKAYPEWAGQVIAARGNKRGNLRCIKLPGLGTTMLDIRMLLKQWCKELGIDGFDTIILDYVDRVAGITHVPKEISGYQLGGQAMQALRDLGEEHNAATWTPSQSTRLKNATKQDLDENDAADSMHKPRIADFVLGLNVNKPQAAAQGQVVELVGKVIKDRDSKGHLKTPPVNPMYDYGYAFPSSYLQLYSSAVDVGTDEQQLALLMYKLGK